MATVYRWTFDNVKLFGQASDETLMPMEEEPEEDLLGMVFSSNSRKHRPPLDPLAATHDGSHTLKDSRKVLKCDDYGERRFGPSSVPGYDGLVD